MSSWKKLSGEEIKERIFGALKKNIDFRQNPVMGIPGSYLDAEIFYDDLPLLKEAPFLSALVANPNHIGCHTLTESETLFSGTQEIEKEVIKICSEDILLAEKDSIDGYIASGGTEANIEAVWIYRNFFRNEFGATQEETALFYSADSHYSFPKAANLLSVPSYMIPVDKTTRTIKPGALQSLIDDAKKNGVKNIIMILNCGTTMFGSVDLPDEIIPILVRNKMVFKIHVDGAFGGFIYPFTNEKNPLSFAHPFISSFTLDAHKLLQAPYGTGIFLVRKKMIQHVCTEAAQYVHGRDHTLCGSRSGANAIAVWMTLQNYGPEKWKEKMQLLNIRTTLICRELKEMNIPYFRETCMNVITIPAKEISKEVANRFSLVADSWKDQQEWWKIVVMQHVTEKYINEFITALKREKIAV